MTRGIGCLLVCHLYQVSLMYPVPIAPPASASLLTSPAGGILVLASQPPLVAVPAGLAATIAPVVRAAGRALESKAQKIAAVARSVGLTEIETATWPDERRARLPDRNNRLA